MNRAIPFVVRALSLVAAVGITALIIFVHGAEMATLGPRDVTASGMTALAPMNATGAQLAARIALDGSRAG